MRVNLIILMRVYVLKKNKIDLLLLMRGRCICIYMDMHIYTPIYIHIYIEYSMEYFLL
jgi:hypothetical protein